VPRWNKVESYMMKVGGFVIGALMIGATIPVASATPSSLDGLVAQCSFVASRSHAQAWRLEPSLRPTIEAHRDLMSAACARWLSTEKTDVLLSQCLAQAVSGPRHIQRGRNMDRPYIERQQNLCRKLAATRAG
jgi:hypothetical protein